MSLILIARYFFILNLSSALSIKSNYLQAWFRELPSGVLDTLTAEQVTHCNTEEGCTKLIETLPPTEAALLDWAINLMADVVQYQHMNKMNARNIAMVFAPNMTQVRLGICEVFQILHFSLDQ